MDEHDAGSPTGHPEVDAVLSTLDGLVDLSVAEHVELFDTAHSRLRAALVDVGRPAAGTVS